MIRLTGGSSWPGRRHAWSRLYSGLPPALSVGPLSRFLETSCRVGPVVGRNETSMINVG